MDKLEKYCLDWCLRVNLKKSKVVIFNKAGRLIKNNFKFNNSCLECVSNYKYLGIHLSASGSFSLAKNELYKKALKGYYKLRKDFLSLNPGIYLCLHVFDHTIKPILLYGSEIWGVFNVNNSKIKSCDPRNLDIDTCFKKLPCEQLHIKFCKFLLGVNRKSVNFAVLSELGRFPMHFYIVKAMLKYCYRLENLNAEFPLLSDAYYCSRDLHEKGKHSWYSSISKIVHSLNLNMDCLTLNKSKFGLVLNKELRRKYINSWHLRREEYKSGK